MLKSAYHISFEPLRGLARHVFYIMISLESGDSRTPVQNPFYLGIRGSIVKVAFHIEALG